MNTLQTLLNHMDDIIRGMKSRVLTENKWSKDDFQAVKEFAILNGQLVAKDKEFKFMGIKHSEEV